MCELTVAFSLCQLLHSDHATVVTDSANSDVIISGFYFRAYLPVREKCETLHRTKISRFTVYA